MANQYQTILGQKYYRQGQSWDNKSIDQIVDKDCNKIYQCVYIFV